MQFTKTLLTLPSSPNYLFFTQLQKISLNQTSSNLLITTNNFIDNNLFYPWFKTITKTLNRAHKFKVKKQNYQILKLHNQCYLTKTKTHNLSLSFVRSNLTRFPKAVNVLKLQPRFLNFINQFIYFQSFFTTQFTLYSSYLYTCLQLLLVTNFFKPTFPIYFNNGLRYKNLFTTNLLNL